MGGYGIGKLILGLPFWARALVGTVIGGFLIWRGIRSHPDNWGDLAFGIFIVLGSYLAELQQRRFRKRRASGG